MNRVNGHADDGQSNVFPQTPSPEVLTDATSAVFAADPMKEPATRAKQRAKRQIHQNRFVIVGAGSVITALLLFAAVSMPHLGAPRKAKHEGARVTGKLNPESTDTSNDKSLFPIIDAGRPGNKNDHSGFLSERDLQRSLIRRVPKTTQSGPKNPAETLGSIAPFGNQPWQAPPYQPDPSMAVSVPDKTEREAMEKSSLIYVRKTSASPTNSTTPSIETPGLGLGLVGGTRLRARLESAASTAVRTPVLAVVEYNYEHDGEIVVPAGAKAVGHIREADRSGYVDIQFDSLLMPDGTSVPIEAAATDLNFRPLRGKVEGKNTGKNVLVRSLSGIGQATSMLVGHGSLNQPFSESDLIRERASRNIGEAGDEEISRLAVTQHIVVTVSAGVPMYVVLEHMPKSNQAFQSLGRTTPNSNSANIDQLRQLLQLQQELNESRSNPPAQ